MIREYIDADLTARNSFHVAQRASKVVEFESESDLKQIFDRGDIGEWMVLGGGNNILFTRDYDGTLIHPVAQGIEEVESNAEGDVVVRAEAGVEWDNLVEWCVERELWGLENLSLIPGKVGAAPVQNIGAYGSEAKDCIVEVECFMPSEGSVRRFTNYECRFGYRESIFKRELRQKCIILAVKFRLSRIANPRLGYGDLMREVESRGGATLSNIREAVCSIRRSKLPDTALLGNAGSFFKNPVVDKSVADSLKARWEDMPTYPSAEGEGRVKLAAGWLIDKSGLKGYTEGRVGVHSRQALVLVNHGGATGKEVIALAAKVRSEVKAKFGVEISEEVNII